MIEGEPKVPIKKRILRSLSKGAKDLIGMSPPPSVVYELDSAGRMINVSNDQIAKEIRTAKEPEVALSSQNYDAATQGEPKENPDQAPTISPKDMANTDQIISLARERLAMQNSPNDFQIVGIFDVFDPQRGATTLELPIPVVSGTVDVFIENHSVEVGYISLAMARVNEDESSSSLHEIAQTEPTLSPITEFISSSDQQT